MSGKLNPLWMATLLATAACGTVQRPSAELRLIGPATNGHRDIAMTADYRVVHNRVRSTNGREQPVLCAEPSPDIAKIVAAASQFNLTGSAAGIEKVKPELALAFAASRTESLAQLGQRLATIQLLRDSTYRACEAYANGAISAATYAMIVSRYDDVMVTLLLGEMAAGGLNAARSARLIGTAAQGGVDAETGGAAVGLATQRLKAAGEELQAATKARDAANAAPSDAKDRAATLTAAEARLKTAQADHAARAAEWTLALKAVGGQSASTSVAEPTAQAAPPAEAAVAATLAGMADKYLNDFNLDAIMVGCLSALSALDTTAERESREAPATDFGVTKPVARPEGDRFKGPVDAAFLSTRPEGARSFQDECRAILNNGGTLREAAHTRLYQVARMAEAAAADARRKELEAQTAAAQGKR